MLIRLWTRIVISNSFYMCIDRFLWISQGMSVVKSRALLFTLHKNGLFIGQKIASPTWFWVPQRAPQSFCSFTPAGQSNRRLPKGWSPIAFPQPIRRFLSEIKPSILILNGLPKLQSFENGIPGNPMTYKINTSSWSHRAPQKTPLFRSYQRPFLPSFVTDENTGPKSAYSLNS